MVMVPRNFPFASDRICTAVKWIPRALTGSQVPTSVLTEATPIGPLWVGCSAITTEPSAAKVTRARPPGVSAIQVPTIGWLVRSVGVAFCAAVPRLLRPPISPTSAMTTERTMMIRRMGCSLTPVSASRLRPRRSSSLSWGPRRACAQSSAWRIGTRCLISGWAQLGIPLWRASAGVQVKLAIADHDVPTRVDVELGEDVRDVGIDRAPTEEEGVGNLLIGPSCRDEAQHVVLPGGEHAASPLGRHGNCGRDGHRLRQRQLLAGRK